jgi:uncharacterized membrane protein YfcA
MHFEPLLIIELAALGLCTGFLAGLLGIGGGMIMVPFMTIILTNRGVAPELTVKMAIATSMATIVFTSISSVRAHHKRGAVRWDLVRKLAPGIILGGMVASMGVFTLLKGSSLAIFFALFVGFSATQMFLDKKTVAKPANSGDGRIARCGLGHWFLVRPGGRGRWLHQRTVHDLGECGHSQRRCNLCRTRVSHRPGQRHGLHCERL